jgi:hypothetical protein
MKAASIALLSGLAVAGSAYAMVQSYDWGDDKDAWTKDADFANTKAMCRQVMATPLPSPDKTAPPAVSLKGCDAEALYYGIGMKADPVRARQCALTQLAAKDDGAAFGPKAILMTIYANGKGADRNLDLAMHLACSLDAAPAEYDARLEHLASLKKPNAKLARPFDYCDDITSGLAGGQCAAHQKSIDDVKRKARLEGIVQGWTPAQKQAFSGLEKAKTDFVAAHSESEVDSTGTARVAFAIGEEEKREDAFLGFLDRLERGKGVKASRSDLPSADRDINIVYRQIQDRRDFNAGSVTLSDIQNTQKLWLKYRDAWLAFAKVRYPDVAQDAISATLTMERLDMLRKFTA